MKEKVDWRAQRGLPIGPAPMGYRMKDKRYVIDEPHAKHIRKCDRLYLELQSTDAVAREFSRFVGTAGPTRTTAAATPS
ncbi:MAG: hypothetical protein HYY16_12905 [Planctomycetes bacterium]|nr:hypothetical protein [Planctomycetota bacterium]